MYFNLKIMMVNISLICYGYIDLFTIFEKT